MEALGVLVVTLVADLSGCQVRTLLLATPGQIAGTGDGRRIFRPPSLVYVALFEVNKASAFSAVFAALRRAIRTLVRKAPLNEQSALVNRTPMQSRQPADPLLSFNLTIGMTC